MMKRYSKIKDLSFAGLRRLNPFNCFAEGRELLDAWHNGREIYEIGDINVFAGRNGAGKSTILDLVEFLANPEKLCTLPRENRKSNSYCLISLSLTNGSSLLASVVPNEIDRDEELDDLTQDLQYVDLIVRSSNLPRRRFTGNIGKRTLTKAHKHALGEVLAPLECHVTSWSRDVDLDVHVLAKALNGIASHLAGLETDPYAPLESGPMFASASFRKRDVFMVDQRGNLSAILSDDRTQSNNLNLAAMPSGWRAAASILVFLEECHEGSICLLEEPEAHMHPALQRAIIAEISRIAKEKKLQIFLSTHSMTFQSHYVWNTDLNLKFFEAGVHKLHAGIDERRMLEMLGISGAEYGACNGVIWVEGPSDRIYIKHWMQLYCDHAGLMSPREHRDYSFAFHGGAVLSHMGAQDVKGRVDISKINRNFVLLMDRDNDIGDGVDPKRTNAAKEAILRETQEIGSNLCASLITPGYTIESSLPAEFRKPFFEFRRGRLRHVSGKKVAIATHYAREYRAWDTCFDRQAHMGETIRTIVETVLRWNSHLNSDFTGSAGVRPGPLLTSVGCTDCSSAPNCRLHSAE